MIRNDADEIKEMLAKATSAAYQRGYNDAMARFRQIAVEALQDEAITPNAAETPALKAARIFVDGRRGGRPNASGAAVLNVITNNPGHTGAEVAQLCPAVHERTVRTALRRLRLADKIEQREGKWFAVSGGA